MSASSLNAQNGDCVQCNNCSASGTNASAIGNKTTASGNNSFAGGYNSQATGSNSFAFGYNSKASQAANTAIGNTAIASGTGSAAVGNYVKATAQNTFVFGAGSTASYPLTNNTASSIAFGVNSNKPTMLITKSLNNNYTGKVAIGQVTSPQAKLHIKSDNYEDAGLILEPTDKKNQIAFIKLFDENHGITVDNTSDMKINSGEGSMYFSGDHYCLGKDNENKTRLYTKGNPSLYYNSARSGVHDIRDGEGPSYAVDFSNDALRLRTAKYQQNTSGHISNWRDALLITTDGKIGIGSSSTFIENNEDQTFVVNSPQKMNLQSGAITLTGKVGINTLNDVSDYALAVDGGVITTKVFIKEVNQWPDHVFSEDHQLLGLDELKHYVNENRHLPGIPSEQEILKNGYDIHHMQYLMLEKIEEMTQYILMLQEEIDILKAAPSTPKDTIVFNYDGSGNRISRSLTFKKIANPKQDPAVTTESPYDLFPNPTSDQFSIILKEPSKTTNMRAKLLTASGVIINEKDIVSDRTSFDLSGKPNGIYILEIEGFGENHTWKVIKQ